jgi:hypothetical protein
MENLFCKTFVVDDENDMGRLLSEIFGLMGPFLGENFFGSSVGDVADHNKHADNNARPDQNLRYSYYGYTHDRVGHGGCLTIASLVNDAEGVIHYGCAYCSPKDMYDKVTGKEIAMHRLIDDMNTVVMVRKKHHDINARIFSDIMANGSYPSWAEHLITIELINHLANAFDVVV